MTRIKCDSPTLCSWSVNKFLVFIRSPPGLSTRVIGNYQSSSITLLVPSVESSPLPFQSLRRCWFLFILPLSCTLLPTTQLESITDSVPPIIIPAFKPLSVRYGLHSGPKKRHPHQQPAAIEHPTSGGKHINNQPPPSSKEKKELSKEASRSTPCVKAS
jgi:hypothetical protein